MSTSSARTARLFIITAALPGRARATLQLGDGDVIAVRTGRYVIADFRARDIAAGGEGAPLSPVADSVLFSRRRARERHAGEPS